MINLNSWIFLSVAYGLNFMYNSWVWYFKELISNFLSMCTTEGSNWCQSLERSLIKGFVIRISEGGKFWASLVNIQFNLKSTLMTFWIDMHKEIVYEINQGTKEYIDVQVTIFSSTLVLTSSIDVVFILSIYIDVVWTIIMTNTEIWTSILFCSAWIADHGCRCVLFM